MEKYKLSGISQTGDFTFELTVIKGKAGYLAGATKNQ